MITATEMTIAARMHGMSYGQYAYLLRQGRIEPPNIAVVRSLMIKKERKSVSANDPKKDIPVCQYTLDGELVRTYDTVRQATEVVGGHGGNIVAACEGRYMTARGYQWRFINADPPGKLIVPPGKKRKLPKVDKICVICGTRFKGKGTAKFCCDKCRHEGELINKRKAAKKHREKQKAQNRKGGDKM